MHYDNVNRRAKNGSDGAPLAVMVQATDVRNVDDGPGAWVNLGFCGRHRGSQEIASDQWAVSKDRV
jgi:hypothetical protein